MMKTSHRIIGALLAVALLSGCGKESGVDGGDENSTAIGFATTVTTRGTVVDRTDSLAARGGFRVWAYAHPQPWNTDPVKTPLFNSTVVTSLDQGVTWDYGEPVSWPANNYVSFFAVGPAAATNINSTTIDSKPGVIFQVADPLNQFDMVAATALYDQIGAAYSGEKPVILSFKHMLARISFSGIILNEEAGTRREVSFKSIVLKNLYGSGRTVIDGSNIDWELTGLSNIAYTLTAGGFLKDEPVSGTATSITADDHYLFLLPQQLARAEGADPVTMDVVFEVSEWVDEHGHDHAGEESYTSLVFSPGAWEAGRSYNYQLVLDGSELRLIEIDTDTTLDPWSIGEMVQPVPLVILNPGEEDPNILNEAHAKDIARIKSALSGFVYLKKNDNLGNDLINQNKYFAIYIKNAINHDIVIDMRGDNDFNAAFDEGDEILFDIKKLVGLDEWGHEEGVADYPDGKRNYTFQVLLDEAYWDLRDAFQPYDSVRVDPNYVVAPPAGPPYDFASSYPGGDLDPKNYFRPDVFTYPRVTASGDPQYNWYLAAVRYAATPGPGDGLDATSGATTTGIGRAAVRPPSRNWNNDPSNFIRNRGSIIWIRNNATVP